MTPNQTKHFAEQLIPASCYFCRALGDVGPRTGVFRDPAWNRRAKLRAAMVKAGVPTYPQQAFSSLAGTDHDCNQCDVEVERRAWNRRNPDHPWEEEVHSVKTRR